MPRVFVSQMSLDQWMANGAIALEGDMLRIHLAPDYRLYIYPAVHFERIEGGDQDPYDILGAVKSSQELAQMGADHYENSVVLGDHAYTVKPGFVALPIGQDGSEMNLDGSQWGTLLYAFESLGAA